MLRMMDGGDARRKSPTSATIPDRLPSFFSPAAVKVVGLQNAHHEASFPSQRQRKTLLQLRRLCLVEYRREVARTSHDSHCTVPASSWTGAGLCRSARNWSKLSHSRERLDIRARELTSEDGMKVSLSTYQTQRQERPGSGCSTALDATATRLKGDIFSAARLVSRRYNGALKIVCPPERATVTKQVVMRREGDDSDHQVHCGYERNAAAQRVLLPIARCLLQPRLGITLGWEPLRMLHCSGTLLVVSLAKNYRRIVAYDVSILFCNFFRPEPWALGPSHH
ncbi:hypothetical protein GGX14DRAFT_558910 [Mycena pura]|uniref:Uncharacterized protein n=1 Tax=Mycena pura TaxID=153505 RepID=A0AAD6VX86_9AGAR|nr:hypothetical protein GGX14DRAFT_558910 [Mycena pura]